MIIFVFGKILKIVNATGTNVVANSDKVGSATTKTTKVVTGLFSGAGLGRGVYDSVESFSRCDYVCGWVSVVGSSCDAISLVANYIPGANNTVVITAPVSAGCKTFVHFCRTGRLRWGGC